MMKYLIVTILEKNGSQKGTLSMTISQPGIKSNIFFFTTNNRYGQRLCLEAWHINASSCALNRDDGSYLPQEYLHLVGK